MQRSIGFFQNQLVGTANDDRHGLVGGLLGTGYLDVLGTSALDFLYQLGVTQFVFRERFNISDRFAASALLE